MKLPGALTNSDTFHRRASPANHLFLRKLLGSCNLAEACYTPDM